MPSHDSNPTSGHSYLAALDPWRRSTVREVERLLKISSLTARRIIISDNQALNNRGLHRLLHRPDVLEFLRRPDGDGAPLLAIALREGTLHFVEVAQRLVLRRDRPAIFPWMSVAQQAQLDTAYGHGRSSTVGPLFDIAGQTFRDHIERLETLRTSTPATTVRWSGLETGYVGATTTALRRFRHTLERDSISALPRDKVLALCDSLLEQVEQGSDVNRSDLYRTISLSGLDKATQFAIRLKCLDEPYHENFAAATRSHSITGTEYREAEVARLLETISARLLQLRPVDVFGIDEFPLLLDEVPFSRISSIRGSPAFLDLLDKLAVPQEDHKRVRVILDLLNFISAELAKEPKGLRKLISLRLHVFSPPRELMDELRAAGLSLSDLVAAASTTAGFVVGEAVGQLVGVFGVGGVLGTGATIVVEQIARRAYEKPKKQQEFQQVLQLILAATHTDT